MKKRMPVIVLLFLLIGLAGVLAGCGDRNAPAVTEGSGVTREPDKTDSGGRETAEPQAGVETPAAGTVSDDPQVLAFAEQFVHNAIFDLEKSPNVKIVESRITRLEPLERVDSVAGLDKPAEVYALEYRLLPEDASKVVLAGGMGFDENNWLTENTSMGRPYLAVTADAQEKEYLGTLWQADGVPEQTGEALEKLLARTKPAEEAYRKAAEAFGWFYMDSGVLLGGANETKEVDGRTYSRVVHDGFKTLSDLRNYLKNLFSDGIVDRLLKDGGDAIPFRDIGGALYCIDAARGSDLFRGKEIHDVIPQSGDQDIFRVTVEVLSEPDEQGGQKVTGYETHDFVYEKTEGKWVFSTFDLVR